MVDGVRADGHQRICGQRRKLLPVHAKIGAECRHVDPVTRGQFAHHAAQRVFGRKLPQPGIDVVVDRALFRHVARLEPAVGAVDPNADQLVLRNHGLERQPPQLASRSAKLVAT